MRMAMAMAKGMAKVRMALKVMAKGNDGGRKAHQNKNVQIPPKSN
jgi:hypothetical protein